jgi:cytochrome oxidase Cu insertion factor (SCO1/SenC/PrrC family)
MTMRVAAVVLAAVLVAVACASAGNPGSTVPAVASDPGAAWRTSPLRDSRTGETFTINDLSGKVVAIEPMAVWCSSCKIQQREAASALAQLGDPDVVYVSLSVDPNELDKDLAAYADRLGFDWAFVVADAEVARSLADDFGPQVLSPPSTPLIIVAPDGTVVHQSFGIHGADDLVDLLARYRT